MSTINRTALCIVILYYLLCVQHTLFTAIHKHYSVEDWKNFAANHPECLEVKWEFFADCFLQEVSLFKKITFLSQHVAASSGSGNADLEKLCAILDAVPALKYICLDVANGYSEYFVEFVKTVREKFPKHTIMVRETTVKQSGSLVFKC